MKMKTVEAFYRPFPTVFIPTGDPHAWTGLGPTALMKPILLNFFNLVKNYVVIIFRFYVVK
jgi:hypothetical protein